MSAHWEETLSVWRQFREHWELGLRNDPHGAVLNVDFEDGYQQIVDHPSWQSSDLVLEVLQGNAFDRVQPIYVNEDVTILWEYAWPSFRPEPPRPTDLFLPHGFALFPSAIQYEPVEGTAPNPCRGLIWVSNEREAWIFGVSHREDCLEDRENTWALETMTGMRLDSDNNDLEIEGVNLLRRVQCFWRLGQQVIAVEQTLPRARRREEQRCGSSRNTVVVLRLRREERREPQGKVDREWSRRWIVRGHWRNQWYPKLETHRQIWVSPHVKGPESQPLVLTERIVEFVR